MNAARVITVVVLLGLGVFVTVRPGGFPKPVAAATTPQDTIYAMLDAARAGDVEKYLAHYTGVTANTLRKFVEEQGEARFAEYLREANAPIKGIAVDAPQSITDREVKLRVELVFQDRNEAHVFYLEKQGERWRIVRLDAGERVKTLVPYGSPAH